MKNKTPIRERFSSWFDLIRTHLTTKKDFERTKWMDKNKSNLEITYFRGYEHALKDIREGKVSLDE